jgi:hypothetical protein
MTTVTKNDWRARQKDDIHAANMQRASQEFAAHTKKRWRLNKQMVDGRTEILINALANQTVDEYFQLNDADNIHDQLMTHGIRLNSDLLKKEIKKGDCQLLRIPSEKWIAASASDAQRPKLSDIDYQLVRCVRIIRVIVNGKTTQGIRTLIEDHQDGGQENIDYYPTAKVCINAGDAENAWPSVLHGKLGLSDPWLRQFVTMASCAETVADVQTSNKFPGLPTWYLVDEVTVNVNDAADKQELKLLGLPQGENFRGTGKHRHRTWLWADLSKEGPHMYRSSPIKHSPKHSPEPSLPPSRASSKHSERESRTPRVQKSDKEDIKQSAARSPSNSAGDSATTSATIQGLRPTATPRIRGRSASKQHLKEISDSTPTMTDLPSDATMKEVQKQESQTAEDADAMDTQPSTSSNPKRSRLPRGRSAVMASTHDSEDAAADVQKQAEDANPMDTLTSTSSNPRPGRLARGRSAVMASTASTHD